MARAYLSAAEADKSLRRWCRCGSSRGAGALDWESHLLPDDGFGVRLSYIESRIVQPADIRVRPHSDWCCNAKGVTLAFEPTPRKPRRGVGTERGGNHGDHPSRSVGPARDADSEAAASRAQTLLREVGCLGDGIRGECTRGQVAPR